MLKKGTAILFILLFAALSFNKVANWHTHIINGIVIQHSHAMSSGSDNPTQHSHSKTELSFINLIDGSFWDQVQIHFLPQIFEKSSITSQIVILPKIILIAREFSNKSPPFLKNQL